MVNSARKATWIYGMAIPVVVAAAAWAVEDRRDKGAASKPVEVTADPGLPTADALLTTLRTQIRSGTPDQKERALDLVQELRSLRLIPEVIDAVADPTPLPRHGDTGWGFVGHQAASVLGRLGHCFDGISVEARGRQAYSFHDDMYKGGEALRASGRLAEVQKNWRRWWDANRKCAG